MKDVFKLWFWVSWLFQIFGFHDCFKCLDFMTISNVWISWPFQMFGFHDYFKCLDFMTISNVWISWVFQMFGFHDYFKCLAFMTISNVSWDYIRCMERIWLWIMRTHSNVLWLLSSNCVTILYVSIVCIWSVAHGMNMTFGENIVIPLIRHWKMLVLRLWILWLFHILHETLTVENMLINTSLLNDISNASWYTGPFPVVR
jgi:hypothetical protein